MSAGSIVIDLLLRSGSFTTDTQRSAKDLERLKKEALETGRALGESLKNIAAAAGITLSIAGFASMVKGAIDAADHLNDLSKKTGIAVDTLGGMGFAAGQAGGDLESVAAAAGKLNKSIAEAAAGNKEMAEVFQIIGVAVKDVEGNTRTADRVMADIATRFEQWEDGPEKAAIALKLFGKAGADIIPLLNDGGRALQENIDYYKKYAGVTTEVAAQADTFNDTLGKLHLIGGAFARTLAAEMLPALQAVADELLTAKEGSDAFKTAAGALRTVLEALIITGATVKDTFVGVGDTLGAYAAVSARLLAGDIKGARAIGEAYRAAGEERRKALDAFTNRVLGINNVGTAPPFFSVDAPAEGKKQAPRIPGGGDAKAAAHSFTDYATQIAQAIGKMAEETNIVKLARLNDEMKKLDELERAGLDAGIVSEVRAKLFEQMDKLSPKIESAAEAFRRLEIAGTDATNNALKADQIQRYAESMDKLKQSIASLTDGNAALRDEIAIIQGGEEARRAVEQARLSSAIAVKLEALAYKELNGAKEPELDALRAEIDLLRERQKLVGDRDRLKESTAFARELGDTIARGFEDAVIAGKNLRDVLKSLEQDLVRILLRQWVTQPLANSITGLLGGTGGGSGWLGALAGLFTGSSGGSGYPDDLPTRGGRAGGGPVSAGGVYRVNESGRPEMLTLGGRDFLLMGNRGGRVEANPLRGAVGGRSITVQVNQTFAAGTSRATTDQAAASAAAAARRALARTR